MTTWKHSMNTIQNQAKKLSSTFLHLIFWICFLALPYLFRIMSVAQKEDRPPMPYFPKGMHNIPPPNGGMRDFTIFFMVLAMVNIPIFYLNSNWLIPKLLKKKGLLIYILSIIVCFVVVFYTNGFIRDIFFGNHFRKIPTFSTTFQTLFILAISTTYRIVMDNLAENETRKEQENERLKSELSFLRSQISPHFMFNVLNSIVSLSRRKPEMVEPVVIKLSELMRYMLYEADDAKVSLQKEIDYLQGYIDLQQLRFGNDIEVSFKTDTAQSYHTIEPMLLVPFVENAFKHGVGMIIDPQIFIDLTLSDRAITFQVKNKVNNDYKETKDKDSGIGLSNIRRRLELLYPENHSLTITNEDNWYVIELVIVNE